MEPLQVLDVSPKESDATEKIIIEKEDHTDHTGSSFDHLINIGKETSYFILFIITVVVATSFAPLYGPDGGIDMTYYNVAAVYILSMGFNFYISGISSYLLWEVEGYNRYTILIGSLPFLAWLYSAVEGLHIIVTQGFKAWLTPGAETDGALIASASLLLVAVLAGIYSKRFSYFGIFLLYSFIFVVFILGISYFPTITRSSTPFWQIVVRVVIFPVVLDIFYYLFRFICKYFINIGIPSSKLEIVWIQIHLYASLVGRFMIVDTNVVTVDFGAANNTNQSTRIFTSYVIIFLVVVSEFLIRITYRHRDMMLANLGVKIKQDIFRREIDPEEENKKRKNNLDVYASTLNSEVQNEIIAIIVTPLIAILFWKWRFFVDFGYSNQPEGWNKPPLIGPLLILTLTQLLGEILITFFANHIELRQGINVVRALKQRSRSYYIYTPILMIAILSIFVLSFSTTPNALECPCPGLDPLSDEGRACRYAEFFDYPCRCEFRLYCQQCWDKSVLSNGTTAFRSDICEGFYQP